MTLVCYFLIDFFKKNKKSLILLPPQCAEEKRLKNYWDNSSKYFSLRQD